MRKSDFESFADMPPFAYLSKEQLTEFAKGLQEKKLLADVRLFVQGQSTVENFYIIKSGSLEVYYEEDDDKSLREVLKPGSTFGGISMLCNNGYAVRTVRTLEKTVFLILSRQDFLKLCEQSEQFSEYFSSAFGKRMVNRSYWAAISRTGEYKNGNALYLLNQSVSAITQHDFASCSEHATIQTAAQIMSDKQVSAVVILNKEQQHVGIVTDKDFRQKVVAQGRSTDVAISEIMSSPLISIHKDALIFEAILKMVNKNVKHLAVIDDNGQLIGMTSDQALLLAQGHSPVSMIREINATESLKAVFDKQHRVPRLVKGLLDNGADARNINKLVTSVSDSILDKLISRALREMGPPPAKFVFMIMGSEGRREQTLKTDQDNAIIYENVAGEQENQIREYFLPFAEKICTWLDTAGYKFCNGGIMAKNPKWCQPLSRWQEYFRRWVHTPEPMAVMHSTIFFDFRRGYGDDDLFQELQSYLMKLLDDRAGIFFYHLAHNALKIKPPLGLFRNFIVESKGDHRDMFDIKKAMTPLVDFGRTYALENKIAATNTLDRVDLLFEDGILKKQEREDIIQAYNIMMELRLNRQADAILMEGEKPENFINPNKLSKIEQKLLKEVLGLVGDLQRRMSVHFTGTV